MWALFDFLLDSLLGWVTNLAAARCPYGVDGCTHGQCERCEEDRAW